MLNIPSFQSKWTNQIQNNLIETGRPDIWYNQDKLEQQQHSNIKQYIKQTLINQYHQNWHSFLTNFIQREKLLFIQRNYYT